MAAPTSTMIVRRPCPHGKAPMRHGAAKVATHAAAASARAPIMRDLHALPGTDPGSD